LLDWEILPRTCQSFPVLLGDVLFPPFYLNRNPSSPAVKNYQVCVISGLLRQLARKHSPIEVWPENLAKMIIGTAFHIPFLQNSQIAKVSLQFVLQGVLHEAFDFGERDDSHLSSPFKS